MSEREERVNVEQHNFDDRFERLKIELQIMPLAEGVDRNSWLDAGCIEDLAKARSRVMNYIERVLK